MQSADEPQAEDEYNAENQNTNMNTPLEVVGSTEESYSFTDDNGCPHPALVVRGCGCCSKHIPLTEENIDAAVAQAEAWIQYLRDLRPYQYPPEVDLDA